MPILSGIYPIEKTPDVFIPRSRCALILVIAGEVFKLDGALMKPLRVAHWMGVGKGPSQDDQFLLL